MSLTILKLIQCRWKQAINANPQFINYFTIYARQDYKGYSRQDEVGLVTYFDEIDRLIISALKQHFSSRTVIQNFEIATHTDNLLYEFVPNERLALSSNWAIGYDYSDLQLTTNAGQLASLCTRVMYSNRIDEFVQHSVENTLPRHLVLESSKPMQIDRIEFLSRNEVSSILNRLNT